MAGIFAAAQPQYAAMKIATFPFDATEATKSGPLVSHYNRMGLRASQQMALRFPDAPGVAAMAGARNRFTVIDIDERGAAGERLLADVQRQFGNSRFIVRTGGGGFHAYYRHQGEGRKIRPDPRRPIDLIGGGPIVLPPTRGFRGNYEIIHGRLEDLAVLEPMRAISGALPEPKAGAIGPGRRNRSLWEHCMRNARACDDFAALFDVAETFNADALSPPLSPDEVMKATRSAWLIEERGENRFGRFGAFLTPIDADEMVGDPYLLALVGWLKAKNGPDSEFMIADGLAELLHWPIAQLRGARKRAMESGWVSLHTPPFRGRAARYVWGARAASSRRMNGLSDSIGDPQ